MLNLTAGQTVKVIHSQGPWTRTARTIQVTEVQAVGKLPTTVSFTDVETGEPEWTYLSRLSAI